MFCQNTKILFQRQIMEGVREVFVLKIAVDARTMGSRPSGVGMYLFDFVKELISNKSFEFILITDIAESEQICFLKNEGLKIYCYGKKIFRSIGVFSYFRFLNQILLKEQPELFWEPNNLFPFYPKGYKGKVVLTIHDLFPITEPEYFSRVYRLYFKQRIRESIRRADALLFDSSEMKQQALNAFPEIQEKQNFISYLIVRKPPARVISDDGFFLYIGNLERRKGTDLLLAAYQMYCQKKGKKPLYLGGKIREVSIEMQLKKLQEKGLAIHYLGYLDESGKYDLLSRCSCFLFPSYAEGFGIPPLEAISYQKPVIVSNLTIFQEIIRAPLLTFDIKADIEKRVEQLCRHMLAEDYKPISVEESQNALERYRGELLGVKLAAFFSDIVGRKP